MDARSLVSLGVKIELHMAPGRVNIDFWRVPGASWKHLDSSGEVLGALVESRGAPRASWRPSWSRLGAVLEENGSNLGVHLGSLFRTFFEPEFEPHVVVWAPFW